MLLLVNLPLKTTFLWIQTQHSSVTEDRQWLAGWPGTLGCCYSLS